MGGWVFTFVRMCVSNFLFTLELLSRMKSLRGWALSPWAFLFVIPIYVNNKYSFRQVNLNFDTYINIYMPCMCTFIVRSHDLRSLFGGHVVIFTLWLYSYLYQYKLPCLKFAKWVKVPWIHYLFIYLFNKMCVYFGIISSGMCTISRYERLMSLLPGCWSTSLFVEMPRP